MDTQERVEREINLMELFWNVLLGWRQIICLGVVFAVLLGGMKYVMNVRSSQSLQDINVDEAKEELEEEELDKIEDAKQIQIRIDDYEKYMKKSAIMQMNPYQKPVLELQYYVKSDYIINYTKDRERDYTGEVAALYRNYIVGGEMAQKVIDNAGLSINKEDLGELMQVTQSPEQGTFYINISYADTEKLQEISDVVKSLLGEKSTELQKVGSHSLELISESQNVIVDTTLIDRKSSMASTMTTLKTQLQTMKSSMSAQQTAILDAEMEEIRGEKEETDEESGFSIKFIILGAIVGMFLAFAWIACRMLFTARLQNGEEIRSMYGIRLLGNVSASSDKKRFLSVIDKKILAVKNRKKKYLPLEKQIKVVAANIALSCKQEGIDCIYMTGSEYEKADAAILERMKKALSEQKIKVRDGENISYDAASLQACIETGNIVFVEQKGQSIYDEIYREVNLAKEQKGNILGAVVLE